MHKVSLSLEKDRKSSTVNLRNVTLWQSFQKLLVSTEYIVPVIITAIFAYGYFLTHLAVGLDDLASDRYNSLELFAQGRITGTLVTHLLGTTDSIYHSWSIDFIGIVLFVISGIVLSSLFLILLEDEKSLLPYTIFTCLYITNPLASEIFSFLGTSIAIGTGIILIAIALYWILIAQERRMFRYYTYSFLILLLLSSWYESVLSVYVCAVFAIFIIELQKDQVSLNLKKIVNEGLKFAFPLLFAVIVEFVISSILRSVLGIENSVNARNSIIYGSSRFVDIIRVLIEKLIRDYIVMGFWYFPITILLYSLIFSVIFCVRDCLKHKSATPLLLYGGMYLSIVLLSLIQGMSVGYRTAQVVYFFVAFIGMLLVTHGRGYGKKVIIFLIILIIYLQGNDLNKWFTLDYLRSEEERHVVQHIGFEIEKNYGSLKPIVFVGEYVLSDNLLDRIMIPTDDRIYKIIDKYHSLSAIPGRPEYWRRIQRYNTYSYISYGVNGFNEVNTELLKLFSYYGFDFKQGSITMYEEAKILMNAMPGWPQNGSIRDMGEYIIVNLGNESSL